MCDKYQNCFEVITFRCYSWISQNISNLFHGVSIQFRAYYFSELFYHALCNTKWYTVHISYIMKSYSFLENPFHFLKIQHPICLCRFPIQMTKPSGMIRIFNVDVNIKVFSCQDHELIVEH